MRTLFFTLFLLCFLTPLMAQNESEPNDNFNQADEINFDNTSQGLICGSGDDDYFKFMVSEPGIIKLEVINVPAGIDLDAELYWPDQQTIISVNAGSNEGQGFTLEASTCQTGFHYLYLEDGTAGNNDASDCGNAYSFTLNFIPFSQVDIADANCNNSQSDAYEITSGQTINALISPWFNGLNSTFQEDEDYYKINITEPGIIKINVTNVPSNIDLDLQIYLPDQQTLIRSAAGSNEGQGFTTEVSTCETGEHLLYFEDGTTGDDYAYNCDEQYIFTIEFIPFSEVDEAECNNSPGGAFEISSGQTINALIAPWFNGINNTFQEDEDYYKINITEPGIIKINVTNVPSNVDLDLQIYWPDQQTLIRSEASSNEGQGFATEVSTSETGFHILYFEDGTAGDDYAYNCDEQYTFTIDFIPFSQVDEAECNGSLNEAYEINSGETINALIAPWFNGLNNTFEEDIDYYKINITEPGIIKVNVSSVPSNVDLDLSIYLPDQQTIVLNQLSSNEGQGFTTEVSTCEMGEHFLYFEDGTAGIDYEYSCDEPYIFTVEFLPFSQVDEGECNNSFNDAWEIFPGEENEALIAPWFDGNNNTFQEDIDYYEIDITEPGIIQVIVSSVPSNVDLDLSIYLPGQQNQVRTKNDSNEGQGYTLELSTCEIGKHYLYFEDGTAGIDYEYNCDEPYIFTVEFLPFNQVDTAECNNSFGNAFEITICDTLEALIAPWFDDRNNSFQDDEDFYKIELTANEEVDIVVNAIPTDMTLRVELYDDNQNPVSQTYTGTSTNPINSSYTVPETGAGTYYLKIYEASNEFSSEDHYRMYIGCNLITSSEDQIEKETIQVFPNPTQGQIEILYSEELNIKIIDNTGRVVKQESLVNSKIDISELPNGVYFLQINSKDQFKTERIIKI